MCLASSLEGAAAVWERRYPVRWRDGWGELTMIGGDATPPAKGATLIQVILGDDEHTAADGSYVRILKARKWLYLAAAAAVLQAYKLVDFAALRKLSGGVITLPAWLATNALLVGLTYLLIQYGILLVQLATAYRAVISARLPDSDRTASARIAIRNTKGRIDTAVAMLDNPNFAGSTGEVAAELLEHEDALDRFEQELKASLAADATVRRTFRYPEYAIDALRALAPPLVAGAALVRLWSALPGHR